ncbi:MAG: hypothetical protein J7L47_05925 [Candidatus Odinarchaeota archaeon]|nr:hypothetical protein [Candidatus Odinarchaeota archaeon]
MNDEVIQIMSKLLLKGAKMLGKSCTKCGTPLFEYKGQTFCPKCDIYDKQREQESQQENKESVATIIRVGKEKKANLKELYIDIEKEILNNLRKIIENISLAEEIQNVKEKLLISNMLINLLLKLKKAGDLQNGRARSGS